MNYCFDSSIIVSIMRGDQALVRRVEGIDTSQHSCSVSPLVLAELFRGAFSASRRKEAVELVRNFIKRVDVLEFDVFSAECFGLAHAHLQSIGRPTGVVDLLIGSNAKAHNAVLVTRNAKDFKDIEGLQVEEW